MHTSAFRRSLVGMSSGSPAFLFAAFASATRSRACGTLVKVVAVRFRVRTHFGELRFGGVHRALIPQLYRSGRSLHNETHLHTV